MKFFKWIVEFKLRRLDGEKRINYLANRLIKEINNQGYSIMNPSIAKDFGSVDIYVHSYGSDNAHVDVTRYGEFVFSGKPIYKIK